MEARIKPQDMTSAAPSKKRPKRLVLRAALILLLILVVAGGAGLGIYYLNQGTLPFGLQTWLEKPKVEKMLPMDSFLVNLKDDRSMHYLKTTVVLSYLNDKDKVLIEQQQPQIRDVVIQYLRGLSRSAIMEANSLEIYRLDLLDQINLIFGREVVHRLYFSDFLIQ